MNKSATARFLTYPSMPRAEWSNHLLHNHIRPKAFWRMWHPTNYNIFLVFARNRVLGPGDLDEMTVIYRTCDGTDPPPWDAFPEIKAAGLPHKHGVCNSLPINIARSLWESLIDAGWTYRCKGSNTMGTVDTAEEFEDELLKLHDGGMSWPHIIEIALQSANKYFGGPYYAFDNSSPPAVTPPPPPRRSHRSQYHPINYNNPTP